MLLYALAYLVVLFILSTAAGYYGLRWINKR